MSFQHVSPELRVFCGGDSLATLQRELERSGCRRAVVVCGRTIGRGEELGLLREALGPRLAGVTATAREHSPVAGVEEAAAFIEQAGGDGIVAVGGGSAAVTARAAAILVGEKRPLAEWCTRRLADGRFESPRLNAPKLPLFVVRVHRDDDYIAILDNAVDAFNAELADMVARIRAYEGQRAAA